MWFVIDPETLQKLGGRFDTQKDLADFLGITPQTLSRELKLCRLIFRWKERNVQVVNQSLMRYEIFSPENELVGRVKSKAELARFLGVSRQAVSAAMTRSIPPKIRGHLIRQRFEKEKIMTVPCKLGKNEKPKPKRNKAVTVNSKFYPSINEAGRKLKVDPQTISSALKSGGYFRRQKDGVRFRAALAVEPAPADLPEREIKRKPRSAPKKPTEKKQPQKFLGKNNFPGNLEHINLANRVTENRISKILPGYRLRAPDEEGEPEDKLILQNYVDAGFHRSIKTYQDLKDSMEIWMSSGKELYVVPEKMKDFKNSEKGQWYFRLKRRGDKGYRLFRTMRWTKSG